MGRAWQLSQAPGRRLRSNARAGAALLALAVWAVGTPAMGLVPPGEDPTGPGGGADERAKLAGHQPEDTRRAAPRQRSEDGWTGFTPSPDTHVIYVSNSEGDDATGVVYDLSQPDHAAIIGPDPLEPAGEVQAFASLETAYFLLRDEAPDWMLLKRGDTWTLNGIGFGSNNWQKSGRGPGDERLVVNAYGPVSEPRPKVLSDPARRTLFSTGNTEGKASHLAFVSFRLEPNNRQPGESPTGIRWFQDGEDILFEDLHISGYATNASFSTEGGSERTGVTLRRCVLADAWSTSGHSQGIYAAHTEDLTIEECVLDHNGWNPSIPGGGASTFNHNMYLSTTNDNVVVRNCISVRASATGLQARTGGEVVGNVFQDNPFGVNFGWTRGVDLPHDDGSVGRCADNVVVAGSDRGDGQWGINIGNIGARQLTPMTGNLIIGGAGMPDGLVLSGTNSFGIHEIDIESNVIYDFARSLRVLGSPGVELTGVRIANNIFQQEGAGDERLVEFRDNDPNADTDFVSNRYTSDLADGRWFATPGQGTLSLDEWRDVASEPGATAGEAGFSDPDRDLASYHGSLGAAGTLDAFIAEARQQRRGYWRPQYTAQAAGAWIRAGFDMSGDDNRDLVPIDGPDRDDERVQRTGDLRIVTSVTRPRGRGGRAVLEPHR